MTNREKFAEKILDVACSSGRIAVSKATLEPITCFELECKDCLFNFRDGGSCGDARKNGQIVNMLNRLLTGQKLQLIHRYW